MVPVTAAAIATANAPTLDPPRVSSPAIRSPYDNPRLRTYAFVILCLVGIFNMLDRQVIAILLEPIKRDLGASDTQMGLLSGFAFAAFYLIAGVPLARLADRRARSPIVIACLVVWSVATMLCGLCANYIQLALARVGVAGGEAGSGPASYSMMADMFPPSARGTMVGLFLGLQALGIAAGLFFGGWLNMLFDWRTAFILVGAPGLLLALVMWLTVPEPSRGIHDAALATGDGEVQAEPSYGDMLRFVRASRPVQLILLTAMGCGFSSYALLNWVPTFFIRVYGMTTMETGLLVGIVSTAGIVIGSIAAGRFSDRYAKGRLSSYMLVSGLGTLIAVPIFVLFAFMPDRTSAIAVLLIGNIVNPFWMSPAYAVLLGLAPARLRAMSIALIGMCVTLAGIGLGPLFVGIVSDALQSLAGTEAIRWSLAICMVGSLAGGVAALAARRNLKRQGL